MPSTTHTDPHPLAGQTVTANGQQFRVEDWWDRVSGGSWMDATGNPAALEYAMRTGLCGDVPLDDEVVYGKIGSFGHLVHAGDLS